MGPSWQITPEKVQTVINRIVEVCHSRKIILFGSFVHGNMHRNRDLDLLAVMKDLVDSPRKESVRIRRALKGLIIAADIVVVDGIKTVKIIRMWTHYE